ncbi:MAG: HldE protein [Parachlamydiales bacterium]|nr:HldE protein [Parachlamydiales bacterium]
MVKLGRTFIHFKPFKVLVLGDFMLDTYTTGRVKRISPEAPVPVMEVLKQESRPGGAGNVVLNLTTLGATVFAVGRIGGDTEGLELKKRLSSADTSCLLVEPGYKTPVKNRLIADSQQLIRVDFETITPIQAEFEEAIREKLEILIPQVDIVAISDYGKGFLSNRLIQTAIELARKAKIPSIVDPKGIDFQKYRGATVLKPNLSEAYAAAKCASSATLDEVAKALRPLAEILLITRSEAGISIFEADGKRFDFPVRSKEVKDVTGAGDTVLSMICLGLANGLDIQQAAQLANIAAGLSIERLGCAQITLSELAERLLEEDCDTKIFDESHTFAIRQVLKGKKYALLVLEKGQMMSNGLFRTIRQLSQKEGQELIIYVRDTEPGDELIHLLSSLHEIDYIILQTESLKNLCSEIHPHEVYLLEQDNPVKIDLAKDLLGALIRQLV